MLVSTDSIAGFRAARITAAQRDGALVIGAAAAAALGVSDGSIVRVSA